MRAVAELWNYLQGDTHSCSHLRVPPLCLATFRLDGGKSAKAFAESSQARSNAAYQRIAVDFELDLVI